MTEAYPLQWPMMRPRTKARKDGNFSKKGDATEYGWRPKQAITIADAMRRLNDELARIGGRGMVLSSNLILNRDGSPRSSQAQPNDPGVALYFTLDKKPVCMPCDTYTRVEQNIAAIAKHIEATRAIERYGVASMSEMFAGFAALPAPGNESKRHWRDVLGVPRDLVLDGKTNIIEALFRDAAKKAHPDLGGTDAMMAELNAARDEALREIA